MWSMVFSLLRPWADETNKPLSVSPVQYWVLCFPSFPYPRVGFPFTAVWWKMIIIPALKRVQKVFSFGGKMYLLWHKDSLQPLAVPGYTFLHVRLNTRACSKISNARYKAQVSLCWWKGSFVSTMKIPEPWLAWLFLERPREKQGREWLS